MKSIVNTVRDHGKRYRDLLDEDWRKTDLSVYLWSPSLGLK